MVQSVFLHPVTFVQLSEWFKPSQPAAATRLTFVHNLNYATLHMFGHHSVCFAVKNLQSFVLTLIKIESKAVAVLL